MLKLVTTKDEHAQQRRPQALARVAAGSVFLMGAIVFLGWTSDMAALKSLLPDWPKMPPLTMLTFLLAAAALWCVAAPGGNQKPARQQISQGCAMAVALIGLLKLIGHGFGWDSQIDLLGFHETLVAGASPARMASATALNFFLIGGALLFIVPSRPFAVFQLFVLPSCVISWLGCLRYLYGGEPLLPLAQISFTTALCFLLLSVGVYCLRTDGGMMALIVGDCEGGALARRLLPPALVVTFLIGWLRWKAEEAGWFGTEAGIALFGMSNVIWFAVLIWHNAASLRLTEMERRQAARQLGEHKDRLAAIIENEPECVKIVDRQGRLTEMNPAGLSMLEVGSLGEAQRKPLMEFILPEYRAAFGNLHRRVMAGGDGKLEFEIVGANGGRRWLDTHAVPLRDAEGQVHSLLGITRDVTERKTAEEEIRQLNAELEQRVVERTEALRESEQRLAIAVQAAQAGVWDWDILSERLNWSPEVFRIFGLAAAKEEVNLEIWRGLVHPDDLAGAEERMADAIQKHTRLENEYRIVHRSGELRWVSVLGDTSYAENGEPRRMAGVCLDITIRKRADLKLQKLAAELRKANQELEAFSTVVTHDLRVAEAADQLKSAFLAAMSHELRTPLNSIIGFTGIVLTGKAGPLNAEQAKQLGMVRESAWHLLALINDVLDLSKIEAGQLEVRPEPFGLPASIERVMAMIGPQAGKKELDLDAFVAPEVGEMVSDRRRVEQILLNLLSNAVKFTERGRVTLTAEMLADFQPSPLAPPGPAVLFRVADTGIGIKSEDLALLFEPFRQIDTGLARQAEGTGLGLAISRRLATLLGGEISAASKWSQGSEFTVILPLQNPSDP